MRRSLLLITTLFAAPALSQQPDPLAPIEPLVVTPLPAPDPAPEPAPIESVTNFPEIAPVVEPVKPVPALPRIIPRDWRGVFAAIDGGEWEGARLGIAALPDDVLKPLAKAELFTARGSPTVDAAALVALLAEAPELPQADGLRGRCRSPGVRYLRESL